MAQKSFPKFSIKSSFGVHVIRDYHIPFSKIELDIKGRHSTIFPRSGDIILNIYMNGDFANRVSNYGSDWATGNKVYVSGLFSKQGLVLEQMGRCSAYAIKVHPVIAYYLIGIPMYELVDRQIRLSDILVHQGLELTHIEKSEELTSIDNKYLKRFLSSLLPEKAKYQRDPIYHAVNLIRERHGMISISELSSVCCMSNRNMNRHFLLKVGLNPQAYCKIWQIDRAIHLINENPTLNLDDIAFLSGFYDTAHLSRDFRSKVNIAPSAFRSDTPLLTLNYLKTNRFFQ